MGGAGSRIDDQWVLKEGIVRLWHGADINPSDEYWENFYNLPVTADEVFNIITPNDLRQLIGVENSQLHDPQVDPKKNLETLIYSAIARLQTILSGSLHETLQINVINRQILNCTRLLTRILPFIYQTQHLHDWYDRFFWQNRRPTHLLDKSLDKRGQLFDGLDPLKQFGPNDIDLEIGPPLAETLLDIIVKLFFFPTFAVPKRTNEDGSLDLDCQVKLWQSGIGTTTTTRPSTKENETHQAEIVRLLVAIASETMYLQPNQITSTEIKALTYLTTRLSKTVLHGILCSLLNVVLKYNPFTWTKVVDLSDMNKDFKKALVPCSLQFLLVAIVYRVPNRPEITGNAFRTAISKLHKIEDFQFIHYGVRNIIQLPLAPSVSIPGSEKNLKWAPEMISLFWELVQTNRRFRKYIIETECVLDYVVILTWHAVDAIDHEDKQGILRMCVFVLQDLSADPTFGQKLNMPLRSPEQLPAIIRIPKFHGSYGDFLICSAHKLFVTTKERPWSIVADGVLTLISNLAPSLTNLARASSLKLMDLFHELSAPDVLLFSSTNHERLERYLVALGELVGKHYEQNRNLVEAIVTNRARFRALRALTFDNAVADADRIARERKDRGDEASTGGFNGNPSLSPTSLDNPRGTALPRSPSLGNVQQESAFALDEDEDEDDTLTLMSTGQSSRTSAPGGSPELSEKRRGKQPVVGTAGASRSHSSTSLALIPTSASGAAAHQIGNPIYGLSQQFAPSEGWFLNWHSNLPLGQILDAIERYEGARDDIGSKNPDFAHRASSESVINSRAGLDPSPSDARVPSSGTGDDNGPPSKTRGETFMWTPAATGWYSALLWGRIYLQEAETFPGASGLYASTDVKLFRRAANNQQISLSSPKGAIDAIGASIAQKISSFSIK